MRFKRERMISDYVPIVGHAADGVLLNDDGSMVAVVEVTGLPWETSGAGDVNDRFRRLVHTWKNIARDTLILGVYQCRGMASPDVYPQAEFRSRFAAEFDAAYQRSLFSGSLYDNRIFIMIQIRPARPAGELLGEQISKRKRKDVIEPQEERLKRLEDVCQLLISELSAYRPRRLGIAVRGHAMFSEMAEAIVFAMTGQWRPIPLTRGRLGDTMFTERVIVGRETIEFRLPGRSWYAAAFGMRQFPASTWPGMLNGFLASSYQNTIFQSFRFVPSHIAQSVMKRKQSRMFAADDPAISQAASLSEAADQIGSADWVLGDYSLCVLAFADSPRSLADVATLVWGDLANSGATVARENTALEAALFQMVPGNDRFRPRPGYISSRNFAALAPLHSFPTGAVEGYWGPPALIMRTTGGTAYNYHYHVGDTGNTFVTGRAGAGKSTFLGACVTQADRMGATTILFDKDRGLKMATLALDGIYLELRNPTGLAPLKALSGSDDDLGFLASLIRGLIAAGGSYEMTQEEDRRLHLALRTVMAMAPADRSMAEVRAFLGVDENGAGARLDKWCWGAEYGWVVDCPADVIRLDAPVLGFDQTTILDNPMARGPVMATLYHRIEKLIDGRRLLFIIDEAWKSLLDESFRDLVHDKLKTLRKRNSPMILATQSPRDALNSVISHTIREQCPSKICFDAGASASWEDYEELGLTPAEFGLVRGLPRGHALVKQGDVSALAHLPLDDMGDFVAVLSGRESTTRIFDNIQADGGDMTDTIERFNKARVAEGAI